MVMDERGRSPMEMVMDEGAISVIEERKR